MRLVKYFFLLLCLLSNSMSFAADEFVSSTYGEKWFLIEGVGVTGQYAYISSLTLKHGSVSDLSNPGDAYLWCIMKSGSFYRIYNKSLGQSYQLSTSTSTTSSITMSTSNNSNFDITSTTYSSYSGYCIAVSGTTTSMYLNLYGGSDWSSTFSAAPIGYWSSVDQNSLWSFVEPESSSDVCNSDSGSSVSKEGYKLVFSSETAKTASQYLDLTDAEKKKCTGSFADQETLEQYWDYSPKKTSTWNKRMGSTLEEKRINVGYSNETLKLKANEVDGAFLTSGVETKEYYQYGIFEIKARCLNAQTGNFPALWFMPNDQATVDWPYCGEIDLMEMVNNSYTVYGTIHNATCQCVSGQSGYYSGTTNADNKYHIYTLVWDETSLTWYMDGKQYYKYEKNDTDAFPFNKPYRILVNQSVGDTGQWAQAPVSGCEYEMDVAYVRVYQIPSETETTITRNVTPGTYESFSLPFDVKVSDLSQYFDKVYQISGSSVEELGSITGDAPIEGDNGDVDGAKPTRFETMRKASTEEPVSEDIAEDYFAYPPFAIYLNTTKSPKTYHVFCHEVPALDSDGEDNYIESGLAFYGRVKENVTSVSFTGEVDDVELVNVEQGLTIYNYVPRESTSDEINDVGMCIEDSSTDGYAYKYNKDGTFSPSANALELYHGGIVGSASGMNFVVHYDNFQSDVHMIKTVTRCDANRDGEVNVSDVTAVVSSLLGEETTGTFDAIAADANDDDAVGTGDIPEIVDAILER